MEITCYRDPESARESRFLPAATYNLAHALLSRSPSGCLFVPIRALNDLAAKGRCDGPAKVLEFPAPERP